jgi:hypothetical protein
MYYSGMEAIDCTSDNNVIYAYSCSKSFSVSSMTCNSTESTEFRKCSEVEEDRNTADIDKTILNVTGAANRLSRAVGGGKYLL